MLEWATAAAATELAAAQPADTKLRALIAVLSTGDQQRMERFVRAVYDPAVLDSSSASERADRLARLYVDTGGFSLSRLVRTTPNEEVAVARARFTELPYCLTAKTRRVGHRELITDFAAADMPLPASKYMRTPGPREVASTMTRFMDRLAKEDVFSGVILIAKDGVPFFRKAYGRADLQGTPVTVDTPFSIASIGKTITATLVGQLIDEGKITLDDKVGKFLPDYPDKDVRERVTVRHLLTHTSGLGEKSEFTNSPDWLARRTGIRSISDFLPLITGHSLETEPGTHYSYSNAGYVILGMIIERASGYSFYDMAQSRVLTPAGMTHSYYDDVVYRAGAAKPLTNFVLQGNDYVFRLGPKRDASEDGSSIGGSHGGTIVTADDLLKFMNALKASKLTTLATARMLTSPQGVGRLQDLKNGYGFEIASQNGHTIVGHTGGDLGISAFLYDFKDTGYTAIVLSNYDPRAIRAIAREVRGLLTRSVIGTPLPPPLTNCSRAVRQRS